MKDFTLRASCSESPWLAFLLSQLEEYLAGKWGENKAEEFVDRIEGEILGEKEEGENEASRFC